MLVILVIFQAAWRGHRQRLKRPDVVEYLALKRRERFKAASIKRIQALWKAVLVQRRYMQMQEGVWVLQASREGVPIPISTYRVRGV